MATYINANGTKVFISTDSWFVKANRTYGPVKGDIYYSGKLFVDGKLSDSDYEISQTKLDRYFQQAVNA